MSGNSFGNNFVVTTFGESHGVALGCIVDGCPPGLEISEEEIQAARGQVHTGKDIAQAFEVLGGYAAANAR